MKKLIFNFKSKDVKKLKNPKNILGGKGANLAEMGRLGLPVPHGFTISTEACHLFYGNKKKLNSKIINVNIKETNQDLLKIKNTYFATEGNKQNLLHVFSVLKKLNVNKSILFKVLDRFKGLKFRQQIIYKSKKLTLINDSKSTSYSSSTNILKSLKKAYWIVGGIPKTGDKFLMSKKECSNIKAYIFGKNKHSFIKELKNKIKYEHFDDLKQALKKIIFDIKVKKKEKEHKTILFSPSAASFDSFKNFEDRGEKFNKLIKKLNLKIILNAR